MDDQFRIAIDTIPGLVWTSLPDGHIDFLNQRWLDYTGLSMEEARGWGWQAAISPDDLPSLLATWRAVLASGAPGEAMARLRRFDGEFRWFLFRAAPLHDAAGSVVKWYGQTTDIEERKRAESQLAAEKRLLEMIAKGTALPTILEALCKTIEETRPCSQTAISLVTPSDGRLQHGAAPTLAPSVREAIHGRPASDAGPCGMAALLNAPVIVDDLETDLRWAAHASSQAAVASGLRACWSTPIAALDGRILGTLAIYLRKPGAPTPLQQTVIEPFTHIASIAIERAQAEDTLRRSEMYLAEAQRLSVTGSFSWRVKTGEIIWSEQTYRIYQLDPAVPATFDIVRTRLHPEETAMFQEIVDRATVDGGDLEFEHRLLMPDGAIKHLHVVAHAMRDETGQLVEYVGAVRDVTELRRSEEALHNVRAELAHATRATTLGQLTASIAHEVNQPLAGIMTNADTCLKLLEDHPPDLEGARETAQRTIRDAGRAADVVVRLRRLFNKQNPVSERLDLNDAIRDLAALMRIELQKGSVILRMDLASNLPIIWGDRVQLQQVMLNLIVNACDAMSAVYDRPRELTIRTETPDADQVRVTVQDSGVGLDPANADAVFDAFYTSKAGGMGMGLSVSRSIIQSHHGRLWSEPNVGPGASFCFTLATTPARAPGRLQAPRRAETSA